MGSINYNVGYIEEQRNERGYKLKDISIPIKINRNNYDIQAEFDLQAVEQSIHNIFHWYRGERILNQEFGNPLIQYIYEPINEDTSRKIGASLKNALNAWDGRINVIEVRVIPYEDDNQYDITVLYDVPILNLYSMDYNKLVTID